MFWYAECLWTQDSKVSMMRGTRRIKHGGGKQSAYLEMAALSQVGVPIASAVCGKLGLVRACTGGLKSPRVVVLLPIDAVL